MYSRYDPTGGEGFSPVDGHTTLEFPRKESEQPTPAPPEPPVETGAPSKEKKPGLLDSLRGLLGGLRSGGADELDLGDLLLLAIIALLLLEDGDETDLIIFLAVALFMGF